MSIAIFGTRPKGNANVKPGKKRETIALAWDSNVGQIAGTGGSCDRYKLVYGVEIPPVDATILAAPA